MKFYRVRLHCHNEGSAGYAWTTNRAEADVQAREFRQAHTIKSQDDDFHNASMTEVEVIEIKPTKAGILEALNLYASHNDNG